MQALIKDLKADLTAFKLGKPKIQSIFIGGGTPSLFSPKTYAKLLSNIRTLVELDSACEITMEVNPGTLEYQDLGAYVKTGINRFSFGVQSFNTQHLKALGRIHSAQEAKDAIVRAKQSGVHTFNIDIMFGLPQQSLESALNDLKIAIDQGPDHISWYELTIEPNTYFYNHPPSLPVQDEVMEIWERGKKILATNGYDQYEVSAYAKEGKVCKHNLNYWNFGDYLGLGAGAHGKISNWETQSITRTKKTRLPEHYLQQAKRLIRHIKKEELILEFMMNGLRLKEGFSVKTFIQNTGLDEEVLNAAMQAAQQKGLLEKSGSQISCTPKGYAHINEMLALF